ncbi:MAG TPA: hypothetical protein VFU46_03335 [Gemmatimonadales bacterium]|nr:hypothetical protein [Gemmatimonadales bacterium]
MAVAALLLAALYVLPLWRIDLTAPQYPEGLGLRIRVDGITGRGPNDLASINNLNHYIGMQRIEPDAIPELRLMPWIAAGLIVIGLAAAASGRRGVLYAWLAALVIAAAAGLADFWRWGYDYGHNLDPSAAIKVPGMSYQPPLIGGKALLNFRAESWPDLGGLLAFAVVAAAAVVAVLEYRRAQRLRAGSPADQRLAVGTRAGELVA